ncbi:MAG TPA: LCP family protein [Mycobacterium sp.]|nr:LCP family protein [Mycobacterium sp.]
MSDGDNDATPGRPRASDLDGAQQWLTRTPRPSRTAAPWERHSGPAPDADDPSSTTGNHTDGVAVADLIAKITGSVPADLASNQPGPEPSPPPQPRPRQQPPGRRQLRPAAVVPPRSSDSSDPDTEVIPAVSYAEELPDLAALRRARAERIAPKRVGEPIAPPKKPKARRRVMLAGRSLAALFAVLALAMTGGAWQWQSSKNNMLNRISALDPNSRDIVDPNAQYGDENFLIVGVDSRYGQNADMGDVGNTDVAGGTRSDTIMLVNIPANRERVVAVSFPRDLNIQPMKCEPWNPETREYGPLYDDQTGQYGPDQVYTETKLNSAYAFGGPKCLVKVIQKLSGLSINRFMAVDFSGFSKMVDALGGVEVCSTTPLEDYEIGTVLPNAGRQMIDGHTALQYVRARQVTTETNGDYGRIKRQQLFLSSLLRSMISKEVFFSLTKLNDVVNQFINDSFVDNIKTKDLVNLGQSVQGIAAGRITFLTVPTTGYMDEWGNEHLREDDTRAIFDAIINDDPLPEEKNADNTPVPGAPESLKNESAQTTSETPAPQPAADAGEVVDAVTTDPTSVTVQVSNSTGQDGLGATAATELQQHGFNVETPDTYASSLSETTVFFSPGNEEAAATVASAFADPTIERVGGKGKTVQVVLGSDFNSVSPPKPSGSSVQVHVLHGGSSNPTQLPADLSVTNAADTTCG